MIKSFLINYLFISLFIFLSPTLYATELDSLENILRTEIDIIQRQHVLTVLCSLYWENSSAKAIEYGQEAVHISIKHNLNDSLAKAYNYCGIAYDFGGDYKQALLCFEKAQIVSKQYCNESQLGEAFLNMGIIYKYQNKYDTANFYIDSALIIFTRNNLKSKMADCKSNKGMICQSEGDFGRALEFYKSALNILDTSNYTNKLANAYNNIGTAYLYLNSYEKAVIYFFKSLNIYEKTNGSGIRLAMSYNNIAIVHSKQEEYKKAMVFYFKAYNIYKGASFKENQTISLYNIAENFALMMQHDSALYYYQMAENEAIQMQNKYILLHIYNAKGNVCLKMNNLDKALSSFQCALKFSDEIGDEMGKTNSHINLGKYYFDLKLYSKCLNHLKIGQQLAEKNGYSELNMIINKLLSNYYQNTNNYKEAFAALGVYVDLKDTIFSDSKYKQISQLHIVYETEQKENEIAMLSSENKSRNAELKQQKTISLSLAIGIGLVILFLIILGVQLKQKYDAYAVLVRKNLMLVKLEDNTKSKYQESNLQNEEHEKIISALMLKMKEEKIYFDRDLNINDLSKQLNTNSKYLSQVVNSSFNSNFNNFINEFRVKEAQKLLSDNSNDVFTLEGIASNVGFSNRTTFNAAFKKYTGVTPSFYKKSIQEV